MRVLAFAADHLHWLVPVLYVRNEAVGWVCRQCGRHTGTLDIRLSAFKREKFWKGE